MQGLRRKWSTQLAEDQARRLGNLVDELVSAAGYTVRFNAGLGYALLSVWAAHLAADHTAAGYEVHPAVEKAVYLIRDDPGPMGVQELAPATVGFSLAREVEK